MKQFLKHIMVFTLFTIVFYVIGICFFGEIMPSYFKPNLKYIVGASGHSYSRLKEVKKIDSVDVLFLGNSQAYRGFDTRVFKKHELSSFNLGTSGQTFLQTKLILKRYLETIHTEQVLFQVSPSMFHELGVESSIDILSNDINDFSSVEMAFSTQDIQVYNTLIYSIFNDITGEKDNYIEKKEKRNDVYVEGGYVEKYKNDSFVFKDLNTDFEFNETQIKAFKEVVKMIRNKGITPIFINAPISKDLIIDEAVLKKFDSLVKAQGDYYDFNIILDLDNSHFYDSNHLNKKGVRLFNTKLIEVLKL